MRKSWAVAAVVLALSGVVSTGQAQACDEDTDGRCASWSTTWNSGRNMTPKGARTERALDAAVYGNRLYAVGESWDGAEDSDMILLALNATSGNVLWDARLGGRHPSPGRDFDIAISVDVSPDGRTVYVAGTRNHSWRRHGDLTLAAFRSSDGKRLWVRSPYKGRAWGTKVSVAPSGRRIFVTGSARLDGYRWQAVTAAYDRKGKLRWRAHFGTRENREGASDLAVDADRVYVTTYSDDRDRAVTVAYSKAGARVWKRKGPPGRPVLALDGERVYVFGTRYSGGQRSGSHFGVLQALDTGGRVLWTDEMLNPKTRFFSSPSLALDEERGILYAVSVPDSVPHDHFENFVIAAYQVSDGSVLWRQRYENEAGAVIVTGAGVTDEGLAVGATLSLSGFRRDLLVVTFAPDDGSLVWQARHNPSIAEQPEANGEAFVVAERRHIYHLGGLDENFISYTGGRYEWSGVVATAYRWMEGRTTGNGS